MEGRLFCINPVKWSRYFLPLFCILHCIFSSSKHPVVLTSDQNLTKKDNLGLRIAFCITGQLARLEIRSKVKNVFAPNVLLGNVVHAFIYLDNEVNNVKQTFWKFDYSNTPYRDYSQPMLISEIDTLMKQEGIENVVKVWVHLSSPNQDKYPVVNNIIPVSDKLIHKTEKVSDNVYPVEGVERADVRFQNNMRWLGGLRDCMKWVQKIEYQQGIFYDLVVRLREDTYAFGPWILTDRYKFALSSAGAASFRGINDHNFVIDRLYADDLFRGITEDYYFNKTLAQEHWGNPERRIYQIAQSYNIPIQNNTICQQPLIPLRGKYDKKHWSLHTAYATKLLDECFSEYTKANGCICSERWIRLLKIPSVLIE